MPEYQYVEVSTNTGTQAAQPPAESLEQKYERLYAQQQSQLTNASQELNNTVSTLKQELDTLRAAQAAAQTPVTPTNPNGEPTWVGRIREGKYVDADEEIYKSVEKRLAQRFEQVRSQAYQDALSASQVNIEMDRHLNKVRSAPENADILEFEPYLEGPISRKVEAAKASGKIKTQADFLQVYKTAVDEEVSNLRNKVLQIRGQGKQEAQVRNQQVLSSVPLQPQQVQSAQGTPAQEQVDDSLDSYFQRRKMQEQRNHGMA